MEITEVNISLRHEEKLKGFVTITFDDRFVICGLKIIHGTKGYFVAMPSRKRKDGLFVEIAHPITNDFRVKMEKIVLSKYWELVEHGVIGNPNPEMALSV